MTLQNSKNTAIDKALIILKLFAPSNRELGTTEVSKILGFHRATVSRILLTLTKHGFLRQDPVSKTFSLGTAFIQLSSAHEQYLRNNIIQIAKPHVDRLSMALKETIILELLSEGTTIMAYAMEGSYSVRFASPVGAILPPSAAGAKAIFAHMDHEPWVKTFEQGIEKRTKLTTTNIAAYRKALKVSKQAGIGIDNGEIDDKLAAVSAPIFNFRGEPIAAIDIVGKKEKIKVSPDSKMVKELLQTARHISAELGWTNSH